MGSEEGENEQKSLRPAALALFDSWGALAFFVSQICRIKGGH